MKKRHLFALTLTLFLLVSPHLRSQSLCREVIAASGGTATVGTQHFEFTVGEPVILTLSSGDRTLTQGFQQPEACLAPTISAHEAPPGLRFTLFPNPTSGTLQLAFSEPIKGKLDLQILNALGQTVHALFQLDQAALNLVDCAALPAGTYFLLLLNTDSGLVARAPFVKSSR
jgi:hypothetical protein